MNRYDVNDRVRLATNIQVDSADRDPTALALKVKDPSGTITTYAITDLTKGSVGDYYKDVTVTAPGTWYYRFEGTSPAEGAGENGLYVVRSEF